jgi:hypothetical protein
MSRVLNVLIALDVFLFAVLCLGNVRQGETASAASWSLRLDGKRRGRWAVAVIDQLFGRGHCKAAFEWQRSIYE